MKPHVGRLVVIEADQVLENIERAYRRSGIEAVCQRHGLEWILPEASAAHPLDDGAAVMLWRSLERTSAELGADGGVYRRLIAPLLRDPHGLLGDALAPLGITVNKLPIRIAALSDHIADATNITE